ncbi:hypothetical protein HMPREF1624_05007 [Sporothrix schenckii ATCC 58251]|uniref:SMP-LTD domain-containing protein n=1 Tax=Sporothrix schenckii (strain ATCC 58251 / de Perez 2211183) TaxID=1391915 RepID=U7PTY1_SPOS1|nr:hypothetical protein HMPREF1624_05007 [Sporothrix schenckii ATCC 58251]
MANFTTFLLVYLFGGVTFLPLLLAAAIYAWTRPVESDAQTSSDPTTKDGGRLPTGKDNYKYDGLVLPGDDVKTLEAVRREHAQERSDGAAKKHKHRQDPADDFATAGYFAVHRKYVAMGGNLRPIERGSSVGAAEVAPPSPSVYQTFFRSMLNKKSDPTKVEVSNAASPRPKNAHNMFYVVLRHGHLILFDDDQQVDVRHVIKLADHDVGISAGTDVVPEGELFIKRNAIHLAPKNHERAKAHNAPAPRPWFFYCENCSEKEDFYFSLLRSLDKAPKPHEIDVRHLTSLMERLHASEEAADMRWLNALLGRLFLGVYKTSDVLKFVESKVVTKLSRTPRPGFISSLVVQRVDIGDTTPQITSPRLKSLTAEGECIVEADVRYTGRFEIDLAATLRVSTPIGQQEVKTSLAVVLHHLEGHMLFKVKGPPSNRIWFTFRHMPKIEMETRPIIMARQLTWPVFIQIIEGKIKEAISESIVLPFWDDTPFFPTEKKAYRGGLWEDASDAEHEGTAIRTEAAGGVHVETGAGIDPPSMDTGHASGTDTKTASTTGVASNTPENDENVSPAVLRLRRLSKTHSAPTSGTASPHAPATAASGESAISAAAKVVNRKQRSGDASETSSPGMPPPKRFSRTTSSLASPSEPIVGTDTSHAEASIQSSSPPKNGKPNTAMSWLSSGTLRSRKSSVSSMESSTAGQTASRATDRLRSNSKDEEDEGGDSMFPVSDAETPGRGSRTMRADGATTGDGSESGSLDDRSIKSRSGRTSSTSLAGMAGSGSGPISSMEPSFTTTITSDSGTPPAKRSAVLAAAMTGAAQSAKRWGINALQRRAAAAADRKAKASLESRTASNGEPLDLSKPMGGGMPLPPPGEPLPRPGELALAKDGTSSTASSPPPLPSRITPIKRRPTTESVFHSQNQSQMHVPMHKEQQIKRKEVHSQAPVRKPVHQDSNTPPHQHNRAQSTTFDEILGLPQQSSPANGHQAQYMSRYDEQENMMVVEAPIDSASDESDEDEAPVTRDGEGESPNHESSSLHEPAEPPHHSPANESNDIPRGEADSHESAEATSSIQDGPEKSGHESPTLEDDEDKTNGDVGDAQWDTLAETVASAFLGSDDGQLSKAHGASEAHDLHDEPEKKGSDASLVATLEDGNEDSVDANEAPAALP